MGAYFFPNHARTIAVHPMRMNVFHFVGAFVGAFDPPISARSKTEQKYHRKTRNAFEPLFAGLKCVSVCFKLEREMGVEPTTFSLGS